MNALVRECAPEASFARQAQVEGVDHSGSRAIAPRSCVPLSAFPDFDDLVRYEDELIDVLADAHEVDGHDIGSGEVNFFVFTDDPTVALGAIRNARDGALLSHPEVRAGARLVEAEDSGRSGPSATSETSPSRSPAVETH